MVNKVILLGYVGKDAEAKNFENGTSVMNFTLATSERWKDSTGAIKESTEWHNIQYFGKGAKKLAEYIKKGKLIYVDGKIKSRSYDDANGIKRSITDILANRIQILDKKDTQSVKENSSQSNSIEEDDFPF